MHSPILAPLVALVLWSFIMLAWLYATRIPAMIKSKIVYDPRRPAEEFHVQLPAPVRWKADNYNNLMEQPTLFYAVTLTLAFVGAGAGLNTGLAWLYVGLSGCAQPRSGHRQRCRGSLRHFHGRVIRSLGDVRTRGDRRVVALADGIAAIDRGRPPQAAAALPIAALTRGMTSSAISCIERLARSGSTQSMPA
jgi:hypothetical protein